MFLQSCNNTFIEEGELRALVEFGGIQKKTERGEWLTSTPVWIDRTAQNEEGHQKSDGNGMGAEPSDRGYGRDTLFNHGVDLQLRIMEILVDMTATARSENLRIPLAEDGREICLRFLSKVDYIRSCTLSHAPVQVNNRYSVIQYIIVCR